MKWIKKILNRNKKTKDNMNEAQIQRMIQLKESFTGQKFQWVKTSDKALLGKIVECRNIEPGKGGKFMAYFDDGSKVDAGQINTKLMMLHGGMEPLSRQELQALNSRPEPIKSTIDNPNIVTDPSQIGKPLTSNKVVPDYSKTVDPPSREIQDPPAADMFAMFNAEETSLLLNLNIKLPDKKLLKMMYNSADNKEKFIDQLSSYVHSQINKNIIKESILKTLDPPKKTVRKTSETEIKVTEVKDEDN
jgi:hypothetical protein